MAAAIPAIVSAVASYAVSEMMKPDEPTQAQAPAAAPAQAAAKSSTQGYFKRDSAGSNGGQPVTPAVDPFFLSDEKTKNTLGG
jgi:hypothetical protein